MHRRAWIVIVLLLPAALVGWFVLADDRSSPGPILEEPPVTSTPPADPVSIPEPFTTRPRRADRAPQTATKAPEAATPPTSAPAAAGDGTLSGMVVDGARDPLKDAAVSLWVESTRGVPAMFAPVVPARWIATVRTGDDGRYRFRDLDPEIAYVVRVRHAAASAAYRIARLTAYPAPTALIPIVMQSATVVRGRCVDDDGNPVAGAVVVVGRDEQRTRNDLPSLASHLAAVMKRSPWLEVRSGPDGHFVYPGTPFGPVVFCAIADGRQLAVARTKATPRTPPVELTLLRGYEIRGRVVDEAKRPVPGAMVLAVTEASGDGAPDRNAVSRRIETGADGAFVASGLSAGTYRVTAWSDGRSSPPRRVTAGADPVTLALSAGDLVAIAGVVVSSEGRAVPGARVSLEMKHEWERSGGAPRAVTDAAGRFAFNARRRAGRWQVRVEAAGHAPKGSVFFELASVPADLRVVLDRGATLAGMVGRAPTMAPIAGASVTLRADRDAGLSAFGGLGVAAEVAAAARTKTDQDGRFRFAHLAPGRYAVEVRHAEFAPAGKRAIVVGQRAVVDDVQIAMNTGATLTLTFAYPDGTAAERIEATLRPQLRRGRGLAFGGASAGGTSVVSDVAGIARFSRLRAGSYQIQWHEGEAIGDSRSGPTMDVAVEENAQVERRITVQRGVTVLGSVVRQGAGVPGAGVELLVRKKQTGQAGAPYRSSRTYTVNTDDDGRFRIENVKPGIGYVTVRTGAAASRFPVLSKAVEVPPGAEHRLVLSLPTGSIRGTVTPPEGVEASAITAIKVLLQPLDRAGMYRTTPLGADGRYRFDLVAPGKYEVVIRPGDRWTAARRTVTMDEAALRTDVDLRLVVGVSVAGTVTDADGAPVFRAKIRARPTRASERGLGAGGHGETDQKGNFEIAHLRPGPYIFRASIGRNLVVQQPVYVNEGTPRVRLQFPRR